MEGDCDLCEKKFTSVMSEVDGIKNGFLDKRYHQESLTKNNKKLLGLNEELMKMLENLDSLSLEVIIII